MSEKQATPSRTPKPAGEGEREVNATSLSSIVAMRLGPVLENSGVSESEVIAEVLCSLACWHDCEGDHGYADLFRAEAARVDPEVNEGCCPTCDGTGGDLCNDCYATGHCHLTGADEKKENSR